MKQDLISFLDKDTKVKELVNQINFFDGDKK